MFVVAVDGGGEDRRPVGDRRDAPGGHLHRGRRCRLADRQISRGDGRPSRAHQRHRLRRRGEEMTRKACNPVIMWSEVKSLAAVRMHRRRHVRQSPRVSASISSARRSRRTPHGRWPSAWRRSARLPRPRNRNRAVAPHPDQEIRRFRRGEGDVFSGGGGRLQAVAAPIRQAGRDLVGGPAVTPKAVRIRA